MLSSIKNAKVMISFVYVALGGALGSLGRYICTKYLLTNPAVGFPKGTFLVNVIGSFLIGVAWSLSKHYSLEFRNFFMVGILGGFTTFSAFSLENVQLLQNGNIQLAFLYILLSSMVCIVVTYLGVLLGGLR